MPSMAEPAISPEQFVPQDLESQYNGALNTDAVMDTIDTHNEVDGDHAKGGGLPQFNISTFSSQIFWLAISFIFLYFYFAKSSLPKLSSTIEDRLSTIRTDLEQADSLSSNAENTKLAYEKAMNGAHEEARLFVTNTVAELRKDAERDSDIFKEKSAAEINSLEKQAIAAKEKIKGDLAETAYSLTQDIVEKLSPLSIKDGDIQKAVMNNMEMTVNKTQKKAA